MSGNARVLAPEVEALLLEIAADPDSNLLRVPRAEVLPELFAKRPPLPRRPRGSTAAERELLGAHRDEVSLVLARMAALAALRLPSLANALIVPAAPERATVGEAALRLLASGERYTDDGLVRAALARAADRSRTETWEPFSLLALALRLGEPKGARQWWPILLTSAGAHPMALREAQDLETTLEPGFARSMASSNGGLAAWRMGRHGEAAEAYRRAHRDRPEERLYLAYHQINAYLCSLKGESVEVEVGEFPGDPAARAFLLSSLTAAPVPGLAELRQRARSAQARRSVPRILQPAAEVFSASA